MHDPFYTTRSAPARTNDGAYSEGYRAGYRDGYRDADEHPCRCGVAVGTPTAHRAERRWHSMYAEPSVPNRQVGASTFAPSNEHEAEPGR